MVSEQRKTEERRGTGFSVLAARKVEREPLTTQTPDRNVLSNDPTNQRWRSERAERTKLDFRCPICHCHWSSQLFDLRAPSSTDIPVPLLNHPSTYHARTLEFSVHVLGDLIHCFDPFAHFFHSFTQRMRRYSARTGLGSNWERKWVKPENQVTIF